MTMMSRAKKSALLFALDIMVMGMLYVTETRKTKKDYSQPFHLTSERIVWASSLTQSLTLSLPEFLV